MSNLYNMDDAYEFKPMLSEIEEAPVSPLGRFMFWIIVILIMITSLWLYYGKVDIVVTSRGIVIPAGESKTIQPLDTGVIGNILVKEGDYVKKGQILMEIDPSTTEPQLESINKNLSNVTLEMDRLKATSNGVGFLTPIGDAETIQTQRSLYNASNDALNKQLSMKQDELSKINAQLNSVNAEKAADEELLANYKSREERMKAVLDLIKADDYDNVVNQIKTTKSEITKLAQKANELNAQKQQTLGDISYTRSSFKTQNLEQLATKQMQANELKSNVDLLQYKNKKQTIVSPVDGYVDVLYIHTVGGVVSPAEKLLSITPSNIPILIKATVMNKDIGFISEKMPVSVKVDTFDFQKYGLLKGEVKTISKNSINDEKLGPVYEIYITPTKTKLMVEGKEQSMTPGMSLSAEIKVGKRRIIEFFVYPLIKYLDESIKVR